MRWPFKNKILLWAFNLLALIAAYFMGCLSSKIPTYVQGNPVGYVDPFGLAGFFGGEVIGGVGGGGGGGFTLLTCTDECGDTHTYKYTKKCVGFTSPGISSSATGGGVSNMDGKNCKNPEKYSEYFVEFSIAAVGGAAGFDIGLSDKNKNLIPDGFSEVNAAGIGGSNSIKPSASVMLCYYTYVGEIN